MPKMADLSDFLDRMTFVPPKRPHKPRRKAPEQAFQCTLADYLRKVLVPPTLFFAVPMGGLSHMQAKRWKGMGALAGVPDLQIIHLGRAYFMECKADRGRLLESQKDVHPKILSAGCPPVAIVRSIEEARIALSAWGIPTREHRAGGGRARNATGGALALPF